MEGFRGLTPDELSSWKSPHLSNVIGENILINQGTLALYGSAGSFKSMLALDLMYHIAIGRDWLGFKTTRNPVYYFQSEVPQEPLQERSDKYKFFNQVSTSNCWMATDLYEKVDKGWGAKYMEQEIGRTFPKVLIIDPLYNSTSVKLVDDYEVGVLLDKFNQWRKAYKLGIILIHHNRQKEHKEGESFHYGPEEFFGSGRFWRWLDTMIYVDLISDNDPIVDLQLTFEKVRHANKKIQPIDVRVSREDLIFRRRGIDT